MVHNLVTPCHDRLNFVFRVSNKTSDVSGDLDSSGKRLIDRLVEIV
jgi:hypothetical protein